MRFFQSLIMSRKNKHKSEKKSDKDLKKNSAIFNNITKFYFKNFNKLQIFLVLLTVLATGALIINYAKTGSFVSKDVSLTGGLSVTIHTDAEINPENLRDDLSKEFPRSSINVRTLQVSGQEQGIIIEDSNTDDSDQLVAYLKENINGITENDISVETMGSTLGKSFFKEIFIALFFAFICMGLVFLYYFRSLFATFAALVSAFLDIFITLGIITALQIKLTSGGIASFLMLIGYSIDTSILISTKMLKDKKADMNEGIKEAMKTGFTMSAAGIAAMFISFIFTNNFALRQIMLILVIGLVIDLFTSWIGNVAILKKQK
ncbi:MMPL family transporter [Candidatus Woesearchaeota archaeon]|nr:MMPL family transporter [Candidatus Woesearchaeota archaeon]